MLRKCIIALLMLFALPVFGMSLVKPDPNQLSKMSTSIQIATVQRFSEFQEGSGCTSYRFRYQVSVSAVLRGDERVEGFCASSGLVAGGRYLMFLSADVRTGSLDCIKEGCAVLLSGLRLTHSTMAPGEMWVEIGEDLVVDPNLLDVHVETEKFCWGEGGVEPASDDCKLYSARPLVKLEQLLKVLNVRESDFVGD